MEHAENVRISLTIMWQGMLGLFIITIVMAWLTSTIIKFCKRPENKETPSD
ncbi:MAG TPA: hypothetical protein PLJ32_02175 [Kiritimatiellia bacterium]|jgi:heme/copper-type cytochrome/quinol oxidase subunit 2|nr:hypothetical protein [Kiritimatiellia bacterium]HPW74764.1 hypothetical protein [Kiritimatiellia bacterium]